MSGPYRHIGTTTECGVTILTLELEQVKEYVLAGDVITPRPFRWPSNLPPLLERPVVSPEAFAPRGGEEVDTVYELPVPCRTKVEVVLASERSPVVTMVRSCTTRNPAPLGYSG